MFSFAHNTRIHHWFCSQTHRKDASVCRDNNLLFIMYTSIVNIILIERNFRLMNGYRKLHKFAEVISYFSLQSWTFHDGNTRSLLNKLSKLDKSLFNFDMAKLSWDKYFENHVKGIRIYLVKDPMETLPEGRKHVKKLEIHIIFLFLNMNNVIVIFFSDYIWHITH